MVFIESRDTVVEAMMEVILTMARMEDVVMGAARLQIAIILLLLNW